MCKKKTNRWYVVQLKSNSNKVAELNLNKQGFETFVPILEVIKRNISRFVSSVKPLFPGYMFVSFNPEEPFWTKIRSTIGVLRLVGIGGKPKDVPSYIIEEIMQMCDHSGKFRPSKPLAKGDDIRIIRGPFANFLASIDSIPDNKRVHVLLKFMGHVAKVDVESDQLESLF